MPTLRKTYMANLTMPLPRNEQLSTSHWDDGGCHFPTRRESAAFANLSEADSESLLSASVPPHPSYRCEWFATAVSALLRLQIVE